MVTFTVLEYNKAKAIGRLNNLILIGGREDATTITVYEIEKKFGLIKKVW